MAWPMVASRLAQRQRRRWFAWIQFLLCETVRGRDISELINQAINGALVAFDCGAFVVGERDMREHPLQSAFGFEQLRFA